MSWKDLDRADKDDVVGWFVACCICGALFVTAMFIIGCAASQPAPDVYEPPERDWLTPYPPS